MDFPALPAPAWNPPAPPTAAVGAMVWPPAVTMTITQPVSMLQPMFTAGQMHAHALAERERCAKLATLAGEHELAAAIRQP